MTTMRRTLVVLVLLVLGASAQAWSAEVTFHVLGACAAGPSIVVIEDARAKNASTSVRLAVTTDGTRMASAALPAGYYHARADGCSGAVRFAVGSAPRSVALVASARAPLLVAGGGIVASASMPGLDAYTVRIGEKRGPSMRAEGSAFYADDLAPGPYEIWVHFKNGYGFSRAVTVNADRVTFVTLDTSRYFGEVFAIYSASHWLGSLTVDASGEPWFVEGLGVEDRIGHLLADGRLRELSLPRSIGSVSAVAPGADGVVRFLDRQNGLLGHIGRDGSTSVDVPFEDRQAYDLSVARDGSVWTWSLRNALFSRAIPTVAHLADVDVRAPDVLAFYAVDATHAFVLTEKALLVGRPDGTTAPLAIPWGCIPSALARWKDGIAFGCTAGPYGAGFVGSDGMATPIAASRGVSATGLVAGSDAVWLLSRDREVTRIGRDDARTTFDGAACGAATVARASGAVLWLVDLTAKCAMVITASGAARPWKVDTLPTSEWDLVAGIDGRLWALDEGALRIASISSDGRISWTAIRPVPPRMMP